MTGRTIGRKETVAKIEEFSEPEKPCQRGTAPPQTRLLQSGLAPIATGVQDLLLPSCVPVQNRYEKTDSAAAALPALLVWAPSCKPFHDLGRDTRLNLMSSVYQVTGKAADTMLETTES
jgi:hypothetical protein